MPPVFETRLSNGLAVVLVEDNRFPLVTARLSCQAGSKYDPKDMPGLAEAVGKVMTEGTRTRTARQISEETDAMGGSLLPSPNRAYVTGTANNYPKIYDTNRRSVYLPVIRK